MFERIYRLDAGRKGRRRGTNRAHRGTRPAAPRYVSIAARRGGRRRL